MSSVRNTQNGHTLRRKRRILERTEEYRMWSRMETRMGSSWRRMGSQSSVRILVSIWSLSSEMRSLEMSTGDQGTSTVRMGRSTVRTGSTGMQVQVNCESDLVSTAAREKEMKMLHWRIEDWRIVDRRIEDWRSVECQHSADSAGNVQHWKHDCH